MRLIDLLKRESEGLRREIVIAAGISGLANAAILAIINVAAQSAAYASINFRFFAMFVVAISLYIICLRFTFSSTNRIFERAVDRVRVRLSAKIRRSELALLEGIGKGEIYNAMTQETRAIADSASILTAALQASILVCFASLYIAVLSRPAFLITIVMVGAGIAIYLRRDKETREGIRRSTGREIEFFAAVNHSLEGFKEIKLNERRGDDVLRSLEGISTSLRELRTRTLDLYSGNYIFSQCFFYVLIASVVFLLPQFIPTFPDVIVEITTAILFVIGPLSLIVGAIQPFTKANIAAENIERLEEALDRLRPVSEEPGAPGLPTPRTGFQEITLDGVEFAYHRAGERQFGIGPVSMSIKAGEILFIIGGNGSGKSTFLKVLTALYRPDRGLLRVDGTPVEGDQIQPYRELFTAIFSDFHLFDRLYGLLDVDERRVRSLLRQMQLTDKTDFARDRFTRLDLSTGHRKRLALLVSLLDDRSIFVFDELAADQEPQFRRYLYEVLLPELRQSGKTILAVTHDDRYFHVADRVVKMEDGQFELSPPLS